MKRLVTLLLITLALWMFHLVAVSPESTNSLLVESGTRIDPYERIWNAVCMEESRMNPMAYNPKDPNGGSHGIAQIGLERLEHYNKDSGKAYTIDDLYRPDVAREIFYYYARKIGWKNEDLIIRRWNGSGPMTYAYLKRVNKWMT